MTDYLAKAKALMSATAQTAALVIVPLAAAPEVQAAATLDVGAPMCFQETFSPCGAQARALESQAGLTGLELFTHLYPLTADYAGWYINISSGGGLWLYTEGSIGGDSDVDLSWIPMKYSFAIDTGETGPFHWTFVARLQYRDSFDALGQFTVHGSGKGTFEGTGSMSLNAPIQVGRPLSASAEWYFDIPIEFYDDYLEVAVNSVQFNSAIAVEAVPEPATSLLVLGSLAGIGILRRRRGDRNRQ